MLKAWKLVCLIFLLVAQPSAFSAEALGVLSLEIKENGTRKELRIFDTQTGLDRTVRLIGSGGTYYHWGKRNTGEWARRGSIRGDEILTLIEGGHPGASGGGLYVTINGPFETQGYGRDLLAFDLPPKKMVVLKQQDWEKLFNTMGGNESGLARSAQINRVLRKLGIDAVLDDNQKWFCIVHERMLQHVRPPTVRDFLKVAWFEETSSDKNVIPAFLKLAVNGQLDQEAFTTLASERFPTYFKALHGEALTKKDLHFLGDTIASVISDYSDFCEGLQPDEKMDRLIKEALRESSPPHYELYIAAYEKWKRAECHSFLVRDHL